MIDESFYSLMFGRADKVHGHKDGGSLTFFSNGRPLLVDAGKFAYTSGPMREYVLNRLGHNVVHVRGARYEPTSNVTLVRHQLTDAFDNYVLRDTGYAGVVIERQVIFARASEAILCVDTVRADRDVEVECRWHLNPEAAVRVEQGKVRARIKGADFSIVWGGTLPEVELVKGSVSPFEAWVSPKWNESTPAPLVKAVQRGRRFRIVTALCPNAEVGSRLSSIDVGGGRRGFIVHGRGVSEVIALDGGEVSVSPHAQDAQAGPVVKLREAVAPRMEEIAGFEDENRAARALLVGAQRRDGPECGSNAHRAAREGLDYGSSATLRDLAVKFGGVVDDGLIDSRTRPGLPVSSSGEVFEYFGKKLTTVAHPDVPAVIEFGTGESVQLVEVGGLTLPIRILAGQGPTLVVAFSGALDRSRAKLPRFERMRSLSTLGTPLRWFPIRPLISVNRFLWPGISELGQSTCTAFWRMLSKRCGRVPGASASCSSGHLAGLCRTTGGKSSGFWYDRGRGESADGHSPVS
ncbi:heparinase II/III family protein [Oerskovia sp. M15]